MMRRLLAAIALFLMSYHHGDTAVRESISTVPVFTPAWQSLRMGAGGNLQGIHTYSDGTILTHADTYGGYIYVPSGSCTVDGTTYAASCWQQLVTTDSMPAGSVTLAKAASLNVGVGEVIACPSNTQVLYMIWNHTVYVSTNRGANWVSTLKTTIQQVNGGPLQLSWMACDPSNPDIVYLVTPSSGAFYTTNGRSGGSSTWTQVSGIANANGNGGSVAFDPQSSVVGGVTQRLLISVAGTGVYETTNGGAPSSGSFSLTTSSPTKVIQLACDKFSQIWATESFNGTSGQLFKYVSSRWSTIKISGESQPIVAIVFDPNTGGSVGSNHVILADVTGVIIASLDNGTSWTGIGSVTFSSTAPQPVWLGVANLTGGGGGPYLNINAIAIDPSGNVWAASGTDVWETSNPIVSGVVAKSLVWSTNTIGTDQLVTNQIIAPPGNSPITAVWDRGNFLIENPDVFPSIQYTNSKSFNQIEGAWSTDYAAGTSNFIVSSLSSASASSSDGGNTWTLWPNMPAVGPSPGGMIAASTTTNWVTMPGDSGGGNTVMYYTTNAASSWTRSTFPGSPNFTGANMGHQNNRQALAADRVTAGEFYAVDTAFNVYRSTDSGASFSLITAKRFDGNTGRDQLQSVPGQAGNLFFIPNLASGSHMWKSTDQGSTWKKVPSGGALDRVAGFGFGAPKPGNSYPAIYAYANLSKVNGLYQSNDGGATWASINVPTSEKTWPYRTLDAVTWVSGDMNVYGRVYVGYAGSGSTYIDTSDACPWVNFSNVNPNAALTGTVTLTAQHSGLVPVSSVQFSVDGSNIGAALTGAGPYSNSWNTADVAHGSHTLKVTATGTSCSGSFSIPITTSMLMSRDLGSANDNDPIWLETAA
jgi:hypothetical protein